tara:strand:- start:11368 stop:13197 length:1830 start_codon:yes stop_codon:yes gene_type:complete
MFNLAKYFPILDNRYYSKQKTDAKDALIQGQIDTVALKEGVVTVNTNNPNATDNRTTPVVLSPYDFLTPFKTVSAGANAMVAGDTLDVASGDYTENNVSCNLPDNSTLIFAPNTKIDCGTTANSFFVADGTSVSILGYGQFTGDFTTDDTAMFHAINGGSIVCDHAFHDLQGGHLAYLDDATAGSHDNVIDLTASGDCTVNPIGISYTSGAVYGGRGNFYYKAKHCTLSYTLFYSRQLMGSASSVNIDFGIVQITDTDFTVESGQLVRQGGHSGFNGNSDKFNLLIKNCKAREGTSHDNLLVDYEGDYNSGLASPQYENAGTCVIENCDFLLDQGNALMRFYSGDIYLTNNSLVNERRYVVQCFYNTTSDGRLTSRGNAYANLNSTTEDLECFDIQAHEGIYSFRADSFIGNSAHGNCVDTVINTVVDMELCSGADVAGGSLQILDDITRYASTTPLVTPDGLDAIKEDFKDTFEELDNGIGFSLGVWSSPDGGDTLYISVDKRSTHASLYDLDYTSTFSGKFHLKSVATYSDSLSGAVTTFGNVQIGDTVTDDLVTLDLSGMATADDIEEKLGGLPSLLSNINLDTTVASDATTSHFMTFVLYGKRIG